MFRSAVRLEDLRALAPALAWDTWAAALGATEETLAETIVQQPSYFEHLSKALGMPVHSEEAE